MPTLVRWLLDAKLLDHGLKGLMVLVIDLPILLGGKRVLQMFMQVFTSPTRVPLAPRDLQVQAGGGGGDGVHSQ